MGNPRRPPLAIWTQLRLTAYQRDSGRCTRCQTPVALEEAYVDRVKVGVADPYDGPNLRTLCRRCFVLRKVPGRQGAVAAAHRDAIISADWQALMWEN